MKRILPLLTLTAAATAAVSTYSCQDSQGDVGGSLVQGSVEILVDSDFTATGRSVINNRVQSRTTTQLLGAIRANGYGTLRSDYVTQMLPTNMIDTAGIDASAVDSVKLLLVFDKDGYVGDSMAPIGINIYPLNKALPYPIYSDESPEPYYDPADKLGSAAFSAAGYNDSIAGGDYRYVYVNLPRQTGVDFFNKFVEDPTLFSDPLRFSEEFCRGFYVQAAFGSGRVTRITDTRWVMYYHKTYQAVDTLGQPYDSIVPTYGIYMAAAPEMVANSNIEFSADDAVKQMTDNGRTVLVSPAGYDVEVRFPIEEIIARYKENAGDLSVINTLTFKVPARKIDNDKGIGMPVNMLMVLSSEKDEFFAKNKLPDNVKSFNTKYSSTDTAYVFSDMRSYLVEMLKKETITPEDYTFTLTPIAVETESSANSYYWQVTEPTINAITPMVAMPSMVELKLEKSQIKLSFSRRNLKNN